MRKVKENKTGNISIRCTVKEKEKINKLAKDKGMKNTEYIVSMCIPDKPKKEMTIRCLRESQEMINQIKYLIEKYKNGDPDEFIFKLEDIIKEEEDRIYARTTSFRLW